MAATITTLNRPQVVTLGTAGNVTKITPPEFTRYLWVQFRTYNGAIAYTGTDGAAIGPDYLSFVAEQLIELQHDGDLPFYAAASDNAAEIVVTARGW